MKLPRIPWPKLPTAAQWKVGADAARDWAAVLYTPVLTAYAVWLTAIIVGWLWPWAEGTESQRLDFLGFALIGALVLIGLGTLFYQRKSATVRGETPMGKFEISSSDGQAQGRIGDVQVTAGSPAQPSPSVIRTPRPKARGVNADKPPWERT